MTHDILKYEATTLDESIPLLTRIWHAAPSDPKLETIEYLKAFRAALEVYLIGGFEQPTGNDLAYTLQLENRVRQIARLMADEKPELTAALVPDRAPANVTEAVLIMVTNAANILSEITHEMKTKLVRNYPRA